MMMAASKAMADKRLPPPTQRAAPNSAPVPADDYWLDVALQDSFPSSDPNSSLRSD